jgi:hypothetical protein
MNRVLDTMSTDDGTITFSVDEEYRGRGLSPVYTLKCDNVEDTSINPGDLLKCVPLSIKFKTHIYIVILSYFGTTIHDFPINKIIKIK